MNNNTKLAYLAGFFDGEGNIYIRHQPHRWHLMVTVVNNPRLVLESFLEYGGKLERRSGNGHHWRIYGRKAGEFLKLLCPYLQLKATEANIAIQFASLLGKNGCRLTEEEKEYREELRKELITIANKRRNSDRY